MKVSVIIPVYNEARTIKEILKKVTDSDVVDEIIIVDDFSKDDTMKILESLSLKGVKVYSHDKNRGKGAAIRTGLKNASGDIIIFQDADLEYDPGDYPELVKPIKEGKADVVYGSRFLNRKDLFHCKKVFYLTHFIGNKFLNFMVMLLYGARLTDMETCYKVIKKEILDGIDLSARGFEIEPEITAKLLRKGVKIYEVPISYVPRDYQEGKKISWRDGLKALYVLVKYRVGK
ncbi:MAG: glycosyltransferase family 2 protein [Candidatus Omnitrophica bacterium]|nr:glycosyltransferase family 2 protein [Candidatus Omnitrophota bacterium]MDD5545969.1 glycosyltransferase family 2 protein [Candidatus Omnitrophota bacterium]